MLEIQNITKKYKLKQKTVRAVDNISLEFNKGEFVSILGLSGSGKTTLVSQIGGLDKPTEGKLIVNGVDTTLFKSREWTDYRKNNIGFIFQDFNLISHLTAKENIEISLSLSGLSPSQKSERAEELLDMMGILDQKDQLPKQLSGGQKQRVAIARALSNKPDIILADEPTGALDPDTSVQIMNILQSLAEQGHLVIMVTHNKYLARDYSTRIVELEDGKVISNEEIREYTKYEDEVLSQDPSSLQFGTALKIAYNNLKIRKKSTIFSLISLIPSMILIFCILNLVFNIEGYKEDFRPLSKSIINRKDMLYVTPYDDTKLEWKQKGIYADIARKNFDEDKVNNFKKQILEPYSEEQIKEIEEIKGVDKVFRNMYFDVEIEGSKFILVALPPKEYAKYQFDISEDNYPKDDEEGVILSYGALKTILGKYVKDTNVLVGQDVEMKIFNYKGVAFHINTYFDKRHIINTKIIDSFNSNTKTTLMNNYYSGYIYAPYNYAQKLKDMYSSNDYALVSYEISDDPEVGLIVMGSQRISDPLKPLREKTSLQDNYELFTFKEYDNNMKGNNYSLRHLVITNDKFDENSLNALKKYGIVSNSKFDDFTVSSANKTNKYIDYTLFIATISSVIIMLIPTLLVCVILYISILLRTKEIGILKSIGARNKDILNIFTLESGILALTSGIVSLIISIPLINYIKDIIEQKYRLEFYLGSNPMEINIIGILVAFIISVSLITVIGLLPGRKASKLQPNELLKHN